MNIEKLTIVTDKYDIEVVRDIINIKDVQTEEVVYAQEGTCVSIVAETVDTALELLEMVKNIKNNL